jgi:hypothetical protein
MPQPIHLKIKMDSQPMGKWRTKPDLNNWDREGGAIYPKTFNTLPDDSPVQQGGILKVTCDRFVTANEEYFYDKIF